MRDRPAGEDTRVVLAANLRRLRIARHLSLSELARATAISKATLSSIERGHGNPTVDTLMALAAELRATPGELLEQAAAGAMRIVRAAPAADPAQIAQRPLEAVSLDGRLEVFELSLPPGRVHEPEPRDSGALSLVLVLAGKLIAGPVERISELATGDCASFPADVPHQYEATQCAAHALVLAYTPG